MPTRNFINRLKYLPLASLLCLACDDGADPADPGGPPCEAQHNGHEYCVEGAVQWCHVGGDQPGGHFHAGRDCAGAGLVCLEGGDTLAYCAAEGATCAPGSEGACVDGDAVNCIEGLLGARRCGVGRECRILEGWAVCAQR